MKTRRINAALAVTAASVLVLSACTSGGGDDPTTEAAETTAAEETTEAEEAEETTEEETADAGGESIEACLQDVGITETQDGEVFFSVGEVEWNGFNDYTADTYSTYNSVVNAHQRSSFVYFGTDGTICQDEEFGSFEVISGIDSEDEPLVIEYTISDDATWSDGTPVTVNDYLMDWATQNPEFLVPGYASGEDAEAQPVFNHVSASFAQYVPEGPQAEPSSKTFTVEYNEHYPDWQLVVGEALPSHVVAEQIGMTGDEFAQAILDRDVETVTSAAEFWNEGWLSEPGQLPDPAIAPSAGQYRLMPNGWIAGQSITLEANPDYWGTPAATQRLTFRFSDAGTHVQQLANGELNVIEPQATVDTITQLEALGDQVVIGTGSSLTWEHLDFNFREAGELDDGTAVEASIFADSQGGLAAREAFALCVPRQGIVDTLIVPIAEDTVLMNAREVFPFQDNYDEVVGAAYDGRFDEVNLEESAAKLEESGLTGPVDVRIGYSAPNPRRSETVALIKASCDQVGFNVIDSGSETFFAEELPSSQYEVALFAWAGSGQLASGQNIYATNRPQNYGKFTNSVVDEAWATLASSLDPAIHLEQTKIIEEELWNQLFGIPLYAHPDVTAYTAGLENVRNTATQDGVSWNAPQWIFGAE